ncbi:hypothetical protein NQ314_003604 [Rhamnusium bicolor]|uniref:Uncharacterized protein n=1 Tax=Rhamnusium bicolor TaxID=1586634 RepID=A0AAV8ZMG2_9CUCU|nr:hypothetical protein NQ314_003604 [Rhamnusium bicolor]
MNKIHSGILAIVMSIFLIQAADPPFEKSSGSFLQYFSVKTTSPNHAEVTVTPSLSQQYLNDRSGTDLVKNQENLKRFHNYLNQIQNDSQNSPSPETKTVKKLDNPEAINRFLHKEGKSTYEKLLEKDFIKPLLKLYEKEIHQQPDYVIGNISASSRISKEDYVEDLKVLTKEELDMLIHGSETYQQNNYQNENENQNIEENVNQHVARRDDAILIENDDKEHIGEILPANFNENAHHEQVAQNQHRFSPARKRLHQQNRYNPRLTNYRMRKSYDYDEGFQPSHYVPENTEAPRPRKPINFPGERFRPEYEPTALSAEGFDSVGYSSETTNHYNRPETYETSASGTEESRSVPYSRPARLNFPPSEVSGFRLPRRFRGYRDPYSEGFQPTAREPYFDSSARFQTAWSSRRPRVIFPTDLVAFRDSVKNQNPDQEPDWLAGDNSLQDLQEQDGRDRGNFC